MRHALPHLFVALVLAAGAAACPPPDGPPPGEGEGEGEGEPGEGEGEGEGEPEETIGICVEGCTAAADCALGPAHVDEDNFECRDGACVYLGCLDEAECDAIGADASTYTCAPIPGGTASICVQQCATVADCVADGASGAYDVDNYACEDGACRYTGCLDDDECTESLGVAARCVDRGAFADQCAAACAAVADCLPGATGPTTDEDNYACVDGVCEYTGCNGDAECDAATAGYLCRQL